MKIYLFERKRKELFNRKPLLLLFHKKRINNLNNTVILGSICLFIHIRDMMHVTDFYLIILFPVTRCFRIELLLS